MDKMQLTAMDSIQLPLYRYIIYCARIIILLRKERNKNSNKENAEKYAGLQNRY